MTNWTNEQFKRAGWAWVARDKPYGEAVACGSDVADAQEYYLKGYFVDFLSGPIGETLDEHK